MDITSELSSVPHADFATLIAERDKREAEAAALSAVPEATAAILPVDADARSQNPLRPSSLNEIVGQEKAKRIMRRMIDTANANGQALDHVLLVGPAGTGKTTFANVIAEERGVDLYQVGAPVALDVLLSLRETMAPGAILFVDEIHLQAIAERRGKESITQPEVWLGLLEDFVIATREGMLPFPEITVIGATTDPGRLPDPFLDRFPLQPRLERYDEVDLARMAVWNADRLGIGITLEAALMFARAARGTPRIVNRYLRNARSLSSVEIDERIAEEIICDLNDTTLDGLTRDQQAMLVYLYLNGRRESEDEVKYMASIASVATGIGLSRDQKAVQLRVEPGLIQGGYVAVASRGRQLTASGIARAQQLLGGED